MKRHPAFMPLSREHHRTLILAQSIKRGAPPFRGMAVTDDGKRNEMIRHYEEHLKDHFRKEEKIFAECKGISGETDQLIARLIEEHRSIKNFIDDLPETTGLEKAGTDLVNTLDALGLLLEKHIRTEERELFELLQEKLSGEKLKHIEKELLQ